MLKAWVNFILAGCIIESSVTRIFKIVNLPTLTNFSTGFIKVAAEILSKNYVFKLLKTSPNILATFVRTFAT